MIGTIASLNSSQRSGTINPSGTASLAFNEAGLAKGVTFDDLRQGMKVRCEERQMPDAPKKFQRCAWAIRPLEE